MPAWDAMRAGRLKSANRRRFGFADPSFGGSAIEDRIGRWELATEETTKAVIGAEQRDVVHTVAAGCHQEHHGLDLLDLRVATLALAKTDVIFNGPIEAKAAHRLDD